MKKIKMLLYGEPGVGKSVFASKSPKPFFITTDGNYEWLEDFGAKPEAHKQVFSWTEAKEAFAQPYDEYDTIVVDLLEDLFKWCEYDYCTRAKLEHVSDVGYGKGYDITRNEFFMEISKLLGKNKHVILLSHGITYVTKDRRGVEHTKHGPSNRIPDKVMDMIEGRLRYCLRCYLKAEEQNDGTILKKRFLSIVPKENEFGIIRGVDENTIPHDIPLEFSEFANVIGLYKSTDSMERQFSAEQVQQIKEAIADKILPTEPMTQQISTVIKQHFEELADKVIDDAKKLKSDNTVKQSEPDSVDIVINSNVEPLEKVEQKTSQETETVETQQKPQSNADKIAAIKAKLAAINASNK